MPQTTTSSTISIIPKLEPMGLSEELAEFISSLENDTPPKLSPQIVQEAFVIHRKLLKRGKHPIADKLSTLLGLKAGIPTTPIYVILIHLGFFYSYEQLSEACGIHLERVKELLKKNATPAAVEVRALTQLQIDMRMIIQCADYDENL